MKKYEKIIHTCVVWVITRQEPVEDVVVTFYTRQLIGNTGFLQQICKDMFQLYKWSTDRIDFILQETREKIPKHHFSNCQEIVGYSQVSMSAPAILPDVPKWIRTNLPCQERMLP